MSSSNDFFGPIGLPVASNGCLHGCNGGSSDTYPFNGTALFIMERIIFHMNCSLATDKTGINGIGIGVTVHHELLNHPEHAARMGQTDLVESCCVMMGTDLMRSSNGHDTNSAIAGILATVTYLMVETLPCRQGGVTEEFQKASFCKTMKEMMELDCARNIIHFYNTRNPCSCLDQVKEQAKEQHKNRVGGCCYDGCKKFCLDAKLYQCTGCYSYKYCSKSCQKADWPDHKAMCKMMQKMKKQTLNDK